MRGDAQSARETAQQLVTAQAGHIGQFTKTDRQLWGIVEALAHLGDSAGNARLVAEGTRAMAGKGGAKQFAALLLQGQRLFWSDCELIEQLIHEPSQQGVIECRLRQLRTCGGVPHRLVNQSRIEVEHVPAPACAVDGRAVMHFARIHRDDVASQRIDPADTAPGAMTARDDESDTVLIMRMTRKSAARGKAHGY